MDDLPQRPPLTPEAARSTPFRPLLDRVDAFTAKHPEITVSAPYATRSKLWEVSTVSGTTAYDNGFRMIADLESRYLL